MKVINGSIRGTAHILGQGGAGGGIELGTVGNEIDGQLEDIATGIIEPAGVSGNSWSNLRFRNVATPMSTQAYLRPRRTSDLMTACKTSPTSITDSTVLVADPELNVMVDPGSVYEFEARVYYDAPGNSVGIRFGLVAPPGATASWVGGGLTQGSTSTAGSIQLSVKARGETVRLGGAGVGTPMAALIHGTISTVSGGSFGLSWAQASVGAEGTTVRALSSLRVTRIA
ncbi:hypothetical protein [Prescottella equi]|uniref:hypothetical protein n=1 Tax=Rhodococcus hoagii TaxID=43767 RepID=UPI00119F34FA|nr:hypothetical protein [Prescottella equi]